ncbi:MAG: ribose 5-phosphate isomerase B [Chloroflexi bacterium]|nr:ribose 5-phosphate isomerase B [Chloroflexota bacterium]|tara:strand:+ start:2012 stop:2464 length:453 start_codon:yes stop_codon:yes gene_type:complete
MRIVIGSDHAGLELKSVAASWISNWGHEVLDAGAYEFDRYDDYPDFAEATAIAIKEDRADRGILLCGSGVGASITANKIPGIRAAMCHDNYSAHQGVEHDDMNVLCLGARIVGIELAKEIISTFIEAKFTGEPRHVRRVAKISAIEEKHK